MKYIEIANIRYKPNKTAQTCVFSGNFDVHDLCIRKSELQRMRNDLPPEATILKGKFEKIIKTLEDISEVVWKHDL